MSSLVVCEDFYSIQGEGKSLGAPSVFLRLAGCNLRCSGFSYKHPKTGEHLGCDTKHVWMKGERQSFTDIIARWEILGWLEHLKQGAHLVITGGEPLLQQPALVEFLKMLDQKTITPVYAEVETNATMLFQEPFLARVNQINASPKLLHSGEKNAYFIDALTQLAASPKTAFKFVVRNAEDLAEIHARYISFFNITPKNIWLMPEAGTKALLEARQQDIIELAKQHSMNYSTRLHLLVWDEATGV